MIETVGLIIQGFTLSTVVLFMILLYLVVKDFRGNKDEKKLDID